MGVRVKICGITRPEDAQQASLAGADAVGIVFYPPSSRHVQDLGLAREIAHSAGPFVTVVGLFVDPVEHEIEQILQQVPINLLQFHGKESENFCLKFDRPYIKALRVKSADSLLEVSDDSEKDKSSSGNSAQEVLSWISAYPKSSGILLDTYAKGVPGGTGKTFNWESVPINSSKAIVLAGGLHAGNVSAAIKITEPYGVDVSGGVESSPGIKDVQKIRNFVKSAKHSE